jgi:hypothetical protein
MLAGHPGQRRVLRSSTIRADEYVLAQKGTSSYPAKPQYFAFKPAKETLADNIQKHLIRNETHSRDQPYCGHCKNLLANFLKLKLKNSSQSTSFR